ncbi:MAG TPA: CDP-diacylglycerol--serine O-phosphatidyltransferase [Thermoplasmatales archaeon]|nr:CDP-diacylglycerol--serine O-phosphatidyltransferase [Thermoplasmatales archaeon]
MQRSAVRMISTADVFSFVNALFGFISIMFMLKGDFWLAVTFVLLATLSDGLDGIIARRFYSGNLGESMDSLADIISFFVAPSVIILMSGRYENPVILFALSVYLFASLLRLSSFPILKKEDYFDGLPIPASGIILILLVIINVDLMVLAIALLLFSILMVSKVHYPKIDRKMGLVALILIILVIVARDALYSIAPLSLLFALLIYVVFGPAYLRYF